MPLQQRALATAAQGVKSMRSPESGRQASESDQSKLTATSDTDSEVLQNRVTTTYVGDNRVRIAAGNRSFEVDQRTHLDRPDASFCPLELVAAALGA